MATFQRLMTGGSKALRTYRASSAVPVDSSFKVNNASHVPHAVVGGLYGADVPCIVGKRSAAWVDEARGYCHLCAAYMTHGRSFHLGFDRDHIALNAIVYLSVMFPRTWSPESIHRALLGASACRGYRQIALDSVIGARTGRLVSLDVTNPVPLQADDAVRLAELRAILLRLIEGPAHSRVIAGSIFDEAPAGMVGQGEKIFRAHVTDLVTVALPPMGPNIQAAFSQKAWGRTNLMVMYDRLGLGEYQGQFGLKPKSNRSDKSSVVRQMIVELALAPVTHAHDPVACLLAEMALHRLAFEAVVLKSAQYMHQAQQAVALADYPTAQDLAAHDYC
jgi:hypothetical protein